MIAPCDDDPIADADLVNTLKDSLPTGTNPHFYRVIGSSP